MKILLRVPVLVAVFAALAADSRVFAQSQAALEAQVQNIFEQRCAECHFGKGNTNAKGVKGRSPILNGQTSRTGLIANQGTST